MSKELDMEQTDLAQVVHVPTLGFLSHLFKITYLCDVSQKTLDFVKEIVTGSENVKTTTNPEELCQSADVDVVFILNSDEYHADHAILALMMEAGADSRGKAMVGYMRRYAAALQRAMEKIRGLDEILYVRVSANAVLSQVRRIVPSGNTWLALFGTHDLSAMRELLGNPVGVHGASVTMLFWKYVILTLSQPSFDVSYESGIDKIPRFDTQFEFYDKNKSVKIQYDTTYMKGLPIRVHITENDIAVYKSTMIRTTYEDAYPQELTAFHE
ncbi:hypothetical protein GQ53DRAFT_812421 [Thozetella sp. PMI_491]|nr:hypothetical protein GQ53DRAFT_812421 [Thozetella sp. PMI_491]